MRAADSRVLEWGPWSQPVEFGTYPPREGGFVGVPIPRVKDKVNNDYLTDDEIIWEKFTPAAGKGDIEEIFSVEEVEESTAKV
ncbi:Granulocyte-macrophage colony-stimulating factor receptor subunit alpha [Myotis davidii]|uniref:Granulocyte-macrophage colony-stimulating factor receptor subunit alpha n=1 Tax=Myotis davidii TaxID=225400 RepID=L5LRE7_MYODS|nr:Granulocyte-macrophage colony-stimulating factor receptor subunit alpha [Myotis davidii]